MKRIVLPVLLVATTVFAGCEVTLFGFDETKPVIESVYISPSNPDVGDVVTISAQVYEPDSTYTLSYDTDGDGRYDDTESVVYYSSGSKTVRVRARSAGGTDEVTYNFMVGSKSVGSAALRVYNDTGHGVGLTIYGPDGSVAVRDAYVAPANAYWVDLPDSTSYEVIADNQYATYGPEWVYLGTVDRYVNVSALN